MGKSPDEIWQKLEPMVVKNENLRKEFDTFVQVVNEYGFIQDGIDMPENIDINPEFADECQFKLQVWEYGEKETIDLTNKK